MLAQSQQWRQRPGHFLICFSPMLSFYTSGFLMFSVSTQLTFACSKSTVETVEKGVKYVQS